LSTSSSSEATTQPWDIPERLLFQLQAKHAATATSRINVKEPDSFDDVRSGDKGDIQIFVSQCKNYVLNTFGWQNEAQKVCVCAGYLKAKPYKWISSYLSLPPKEPQEHARLTENMRIWPKRMKRSSRR
jgi:hypothetical protein